MAIFNFPTSFGDGLVVRGVPLLQAHQGKVFYVGNNPTVLDGEATASAGGAGGFATPTATIAQALVLCAADRGDIIMVRPGYTETVTAAGGLTINKAGVAIIGMGTGSKRPTINLTTAVTASILITAANVSVSNILITGGIDDITSVMTISVADVTLLNVEYRDVTGQAKASITTTATADRLLLDGYFHNGAIVTGALTAISIVGGTGITIRNSILGGFFTTSVIDITTPATLDFSLYDSYLVNRSTTAGDFLLTDTVTGSTGRIGPNVFGASLNANAGSVTASFTAATMFFSPTVVTTDAVNLSGGLVKAAAVD